MVLVQVRTLEAGADFLAPLAAGAALAAGAGAALGADFPAGFLEKNPALASNEDYKK